MKGQRLTTIAQGAFCLLLGLVALGIGRPPAPSGSARIHGKRSAAATQACRAAHAAAQRVRPLGGAQRAPAPAATARQTPGRARVTLRRGDGAPSEVEYDVAAGDTLGSIAAELGVPVSRIMIVNGIRDPRRLRAGARLRIPLHVEAIDHAIMAQLPPALRNDPERLRLAPYFDHWARVYDLDPDLLKAVGFVESGWRYDVVSHKGAIGIAQLMPETVAFVGRLLGEDLDPWTPEENIRMAARFLRYLLDETGDIDEALAAYYQGLGALRAEGVYRRTRPYVRSVQAARRYFTSS